MWRIFTGRGKNLEAKGQTEQQNQINFKQLKSEIEQQLITLTKQFQQSQSMFKQHYGVSQHEITLTNTFQELITTIQGLLAIIGQLHSQYDQMKEEVVQGRRAQEMLHNHTNTITSIQDTHSQQVGRIYEEKRRKEEEMNQVIQGLRRKNQQLEASLQQIMDKINHLYQRNNILQTQMSTSTNEKQTIIAKATQFQQKYKALVDPIDSIPPKKIIDLEHIQLQFIFYYSKLKQRILSYLSIKDILSFKRVNKFYYHMLKKQQAGKINQHFKLMYQKRINSDIESAKLYQKIYELFPIQNIKINAFKYLHFRIKPATYILPFLQEEQVQINKKQHEEDKEKQGNKFNWKFWGSEKKIQKKNEEKDIKFNLTALKNQQQFQKIQHRIESTFKNILQVKMPDDLQYFSQNMQKQLQQLKIDLTQAKQGKTGHLQWASQLYCLTKYMYHEINQLFNLLQVIFGQLIKKNKDLINITQDYQYLKENQLVLRNLIQNLSSDKSVIEKKYLMIENQILKKNLEKQAIQNKMEKLVHEHSTLDHKYQLLEQEHLHCKQSIQKLTENRIKVQGKFKTIREELEVLQKIPTRIRKSSVGSVSSEQHMFHDVSTA